MKDPPGPPAAVARPIEGGPGALLALRDLPPRAGDGGPSARGRRAGSGRAAAGIGRARRTPGGSGAAAALPGPSGSCGRSSRTLGLPIPLAGDLGLRALLPAERG